MKQMIRFIAIVVLSAAIAFVAAYALAETFKQFAAIFFFGGAFIALIMGAFDGKGKKQSIHDSIRHRSGIKYNQAAVFIGSACLFMGTLAECEEVADDLWHYAQNAEVRTLTGEEEFNVI